MEFQAIREAFRRIFCSSSSIGKKKTRETPAMRLNIVTGSSVSSPEIVDSFIYFRPTNRGRCLQILALEVWEEKVVLEVGWRHVNSKRREM